MKSSKIEENWSPNTHYIQNMSIVEAMNSEKNMPVLVMNAAGYVQKMPAVEWFE